LGYPPSARLSGLRKGWTHEAIAERGAMNREFRADSAQAPESIAFT